MNNFQHQLQTRTDAMQLFRTFADLKKWSKNNPTVNIVKGDHDARTGMTTWNVPQWDLARADFCSAKLAHCQKWGSN